jgi:MFS family permease
MDTEHAIPLWQAAFSGVFALLYIFSGYRTVRFTARLMSAVLCMLVGMMASSHLEHGLVIAAIIVGAGIVGFLLGNALYYLTVALYGAAGGFVLGAVISSLAVHSITPAAAIGGALAGAILAIFLERPMVILGTSLTGGWLVAMSVQGVLAATGVVHDVPEHHHRFGWAYALLTVALGIVGCVVQARTTKDLPPPPSKGGPGRAPARV